MVSVTIRPASNGVIVEAGCLVLVFEDKGKLAAEIFRWLQTPDQVEKEYAARYLDIPQKEPAYTRVRTPANMIRESMAGVDTERVEGAEHGRLMGLRDVPPPGQPGPLNG